jgi:hypothetical protein
MGWHSGGRWPRPTSCRVETTRSTSSSCHSRSHTMLIASCSNLLAMVCWCLLVNTSSKDFKAEHNITFCVTFGLKPSSSFMITVGKGWCSALLNVEHNDLSQSSRKDAFCSNGKLVSYTVINRLIDLSASYRKYFFWSKMINLQRMDRVLYYKKLQKQHETNPLLWNCTIK